MALESRDMKEFDLTRCLEMLVAQSLTVYYNCVSDRLRIGLECVETTMKKMFPTWYKRNANFVKAFVLSTGYKKRIFGLACTQYDRALVNKAYNEHVFIPGFMRHVICLLTTRPKSRVFISVRCLGYMKKEFERARHQNKIIGTEGKDDYTSRLFWSCSPMPVMFSLYQTKPKEPWKQFNKQLYLVQQFPSDWECDHENIVQRRLMEIMKSASKGETKKFMETEGIKRSYPVCYTCCLPDLPGVSVIRQMPAQMVDLKMIKCEQCKIARYCSKECRDSDKFHTKYCAGKKTLKNESKKKSREETETETEGDDSEKDDLEEEEDLELSELLLNPKRDQMRKVAQKVLDALEEKLKDKLMPDDSEME